MSQPDLEGVVLVSGGGRGIGANIARELARGRHARCGRRAVARPGRSGRGGDRRPRAGTGRHVARFRRGRGRAGGVGARADRPARRERRHQRAERAARRSGRLVAHVRGERPRRLPLQPRGRDEDGRARQRPHRQRGKRCGIPADLARRPDCLRLEQGGRAPLLGAARGAAQPAERVRLLDLARPRQDRDDRGPLPRRGAVDAAGVRPAARASARVGRARRPRRPVPARGARSARRRCGRGSRRFARAISTRSGCSAGSTRFEVYD